MKKRGKKINHTACCRPLGAKTTAFEFNARMSLVVLEHGAATQDNMVNFMYWPTSCSVSVARPTL